MKGVFTSISGKVGNIIYCKSGPNQIIKTAFIPGNPKTATQTNDRNLFRSLNSELKILNDDLIQPFWKPFLKGSQKAWSSFLSVNKKAMIDTYDIRNLILTKGSLESIRLTSIGVDEEAKTLNVNWNTSTLTNGLASDDVSVAVFDHNLNIFLYYNLKCAVRSDGSYLITLLNTFVGDDVSVFAFASIDSASGITIAQVSNSTSIDVGDFLLVMSFPDNAPNYSTIQLKDLGGNYCKVDWGNGELMDISTDTETSSIITPTFVKIYSRNGLDFFKSTNNNFSFDLNIIPYGMTYLLVYANNTIDGNVSNLPATLLLVDIQCNDRVYGDFADLPLVITSPKFVNANKISTYTSGRTWSNNMNYLIHLPKLGFGLDSTEIDNLLIDLALVETWTGQKWIDISGNNASRTSASDAAKATLIGKSVTVVVNE